MTLTNWTQPGYVKNEVDFFDLVKTIENTQLCPDCETIRTARSRHCAVCHRCVERFDHHCPWINNCIGVRNHNYFLAYVTLQLLVLIMAVIMCIWAFVYFPLHDTLFPWSDVTFLDSPYMFYLPVSLVLLTCSLFIVPLALLISVQWGNFCQGKTTMERFGRAQASNETHYEEVQEKLMVSGIKQDRRLYSSLTVNEYNRLV